MQRINTKNEGPSLAILIELDPDCIELVYGCHNLDIEAQQNHQNQKTANWWGGCNFQSFYIILNM